MMKEYRDAIKSKQITNPKTGIVMEGIKVTCPVRSVDHNNSGIAAEYLHDKLRLKVNLYSSSTDLHLLGLFGWKKITRYLLRRQLKWIFYGKEYGI